MKTAVMEMGGVKSKIEQEMKITYIKYHRNHIYQR